MGFCRIPSHGYQVSSAVDMNSDRVELLRVGEIDSFGWTDGLYGVEA